jgi:hypothetical protein
MRSRLSLASPDSFPRFNNSTVQSSITNGGGFLGKQQLGVDAPAAAHDAEDVLDVFVNLEVQRNLINDR